MIPINKSLSVAEDFFSFLLDHGFRVVDRRQPSTGLHQDFWTLTYASDVVEVTIWYGPRDGLNVAFSRGSTKVDYLDIDRRVFAGRSGLSGNSFDPEAVIPIIKDIASDMRARYGPIIAGDETAWALIDELTRRG